MADEQTPIGDGAQTSDSTAQAGKVFTQEEVNALIAKRAKQEARGLYPDYDDLKKAKAELDSIKQSQMTEAEKVANALKDRDTRLAELEAKANAAEERATTLVRQTKAISTASILGAYDPSDPNFAAAVAGIDPASPTADADIKAAIESLKTTKPYLFKAPGSRGLESFNPAGQAGPAETDAQRAQRVQRAAQGAGRGFGPLG